MRASSKCPRVESFSGVAPPPPPSSGDPIAEEYVDPTIAAAAPSPSTSNDSSIRCMLDTVMTVQVTHGQLLVDMLLELQVLLVDLVSIRWSPLPSPFYDKS